MYIATDKFWSTFDWSLKGGNSHYLYNYNYCRSRSKLAGSPAQYLKIAKLAIACFLYTHTKLHVLPGQIRSDFHLAGLFFAPSVYMAQGIYTLV